MLDIRATITEDPIAPAITQIDVHQRPVLGEAFAHVDFQCLMAAMDHRLGDCRPDRL